MQRPASRFALGRALTALLALASTASAEDARPVGIDAGVATYAAIGRGAWIFVALGAEASVAPHVAVGGYLAFSVANDPMEADCSNVGCMRHEYKLGPRARFRLFPDGVVDPWLGLSAGARLDANTAKDAKAGLDLGASTGVDVRLGRYAFGPYGFVEQPLTKYDESPTWDGQLGLGLHFDVMF